MKDLLQKKLETYQCKTADDEENALKEISQELALYALAQSGFFQKACFQGGTCLRIVHGLDRFSEDLDFALLQPNGSYDINFYLEKTKIIMDSYGYNIEVAGKDSLHSHMRARFLKDDSIKLLLNLQHHRETRKKIKIKVEVDTNPPNGAIHTTSFVDFPTDFAINAHDLPSLFAGKCHALLCRDYTKGRDWYDFSWYVAKGITVNYAMLTSALQQVGPWSQQDIIVTPEWLRASLSQRIREIIWHDAARDVSKFVHQDKVETLSLWSEGFFAAKVAKMFRQ